MMKILHGTPPEIKSRNFWWYQLFFGETGSWFWKVLATGTEKRKWWVLCLIEGLLIRSITWGYQIYPITCLFLKIKPRVCRGPARMVGGKLSIPTSPAWSLCVYNMNHIIWSRFENWDYLDLEDMLKSHFILFWQYLQKKSDQIRVVLWPRK